jgi:hypothetical protein
VGIPYPAVLDEPLLKAVRYFNENLNTLSLPAIMALSDFFLADLRLQLTG